MNISRLLARSLSPSPLTVTVMVKHKNSWTFNQQLLYYSWPAKSFKRSSNACGHFRWKLRTFLIQRMHPQLALISLRCLLVFNSKLSQCISKVHKTCTIPIVLSHFQWGFILHLSGHFSIINFLLTDCTMHLGTKDCVQYILVSVQIFHFGGFGCGFKFLPVLKYLYLNIFVLIGICIGMY